MIPLGISFGDVHSYYDLGLFLAKGGVSISPAKPKTNYVDVPGADGSLDFTEAHGEVKYYDRDAKFTFYMNPAGDLSEQGFEDKKTQVSNILAGRMFERITLDKDPGYFYSGRCTVDEFLSDKRIRQIVVSAKLAPYKLRQEETVVTVGLIPDGTPNINEDGTMSVLDVFRLEAGVYNMMLPASGEVNTFIDDEPGNETITFSGLLIVEDDEAASYKIVTCAGIQYTYDWTSGDGDLIRKVAAGASSYDATVTLTNGRKTVIPTITCTAETKITVGNRTITINAGTHKILDLQLAHGDNVLTISGSGTVTISYREGDL